MNELILLLILLFIPIFLITLFIPVWTRKTESFGVTIPSSVHGSPELKKLRKQYMTATAVLSVVTLLVFLITGLTLTASIDALSMLLIVTLLSYLVLGFFIYLYFHNKMKQIKAAAKWQLDKREQLVIDPAFRQEKLTYSSLWYLPSFLIAFILIFLTFQFYDRIPQEIPMQYNFSGEVTNMAEKTSRSVLLHPSMMIYMTALFMFINMTIARSKQQIDPANPDESRKNNIIFRRSWSLYLIVSLYLLILMFGSIQASLFFTVPAVFMIVMPLVVTFVMIGGAVFLSVKVGQGGSRLSKQSSDKNVTPRDDDEHWKLGQFYFNPDDPSLFLEKRFGVGWTVNFGRPLAWMILIGIIVLSVLIPVMLSM